MSSPSSAMMTWAALTPMPGTSSRRSSAPSGGWAGCWLGLTPVVPPSPLPVGPAPSDGACAAGMAPISSWVRTVSRSIWAVRAS